MLDITVWIAGGFLALFFLAAGVPKVAGKGIDRWVGFDQIPRGLTVLIGFSEIAAATALIVPLLINELEWTTPLAALGIGVISLMASGFHLRNREWLATLETVLWASLAGSIAAARWDELSTGPSIPKGVLVPMLLVLVPATITNLVFLTRATTPKKLDDRRGLAPAAN
ncbi:DoxX family protein [Kribbella sp. NPDC003505]|uniref:DoxX family protein n=1 Tax=Kribbella sp. NPDC003505 TaxID=3154448 RepID=UPI0033A0DC0C